MAVGTSALRHSRDPASASRTPRGGREAATRAESRPSAATFPRPGSRGRGGRRRRAPARRGTANLFGRVSPVRRGSGVDDGWQHRERDLLLKTPRPPCRAAAVTANYYAAPGSRSLAISARLQTVVRCEPLRRQPVSRRFPLPGYPNSSRPSVHAPSSRAARSPPPPRRERNANRRQPVSKQ